jgi:excisionase family DNA binding protein
MEVIPVKKLVEFAPSGFLVTTDEAAKILGCSRSRIRQMARAREFRQFKIGDSGRSVLLDLGEVRKVAREPRKTGRPRSSNASD